MEQCIIESFNLLNVVSQEYASDRSPKHLILFDAVCGLVNIFAEFPIFCQDLEHISSNELPPWAKSLVEVAYFLLLICFIGHRP